MVKLSAGLPSSSPTSLQTGKALTFYPLSTTWLVLRRFSEVDVGAFLGYRNDPEVIRYEYWNGCTAAEAAEYIRRQQSQEAGVPGEWLQIAIALKATDQLIGDCGVRIPPADARQATISVALARAGFGSRGALVPV